MNKKEIAELRKRQRRERSNAKTLHGCYVNEGKEVVSAFSKSFATMPENEADKFFKMFRRILTGAGGDTIGRVHQLLSFKTSQVANSTEHKQLMELRDKLDDEEIRKEFYQKVIDSLEMDCPYLILIFSETYDVPFKSKDGDTQADNSDQSFTYVL